MPIETPTCFSPKIPGIDKFFLNRVRRESRMPVELLPDRGAHGQVHIDADQVHQLERSHSKARMISHHRVDLIDAGHNYIGISGSALAHSLRMDAEAGQVPGRLFESLIKVIGGRGADPWSHTSACYVCLRDLWSDKATSAFCRPASGLLLRQLLRERQDDSGIILRNLLRLGRSKPMLVDYIRGWARGHFIPIAPNGTKPYPIPYPKRKTL